MNIDRVFAALASGPRRKILAYLSEASLTAGEIAERFEMSKPALSKHLKLLEVAGLVDSEKKGQYVHYRMAADNLPAKLHSLLATFCPISGPLKRESKAIAKAKSEAITNTKAGATTAAEPSANPNAKATAKREAKINAKHEAKIDAKHETKVGAKPGTKIDANPKTKLDTNPKIKKAATSKIQPDAAANTKGKAAKPKAGGTETIPPGGNKLQLELAIGTPDLPPTAH